MALDNIIDSTSTLVNNVMEHTKRSLIDAWKNHKPGEDFSEAIENSFGNIQSPFSTLRTNYLQASYIKKNLNYVEMKEVILGKKISRKMWKNKHSLVEKEETFIYIPLVKSLCQLFSNKKIAKLILRKPDQCEDNVYLIFAMVKFLELTAFLMIVQMHYNLSFTMMQLKFAIHLVVKLVSISLICSIIH